MIYATFPFHLIVLVRLNPQGTEFSKICPSFSRALWSTMLQTNITKTSSWTTDARTDVKRGVREWVKSLLN